MKITDLDVPYNDNNTNNYYQVGRWLCASAKTNEVGDKLDMEMYVLNLHKMYRNDNNYFVNDD